MKQELQPYSRKAHYYETDRMGIIHHSNYIRWFEEARVDYLDKIGLPYAKLEAAGILIPVLAVNCEYLSPAVFDEQVQITVKMTNFTGVKMTIDYEIKGASSGILKVRGQSRHCFADASLKPIRLKRDFPDIYSGFERFLEV
jgi:acyl-CoA thioester hydrolase